MLTLALLMSLQRGVSADRSDMAERLLFLDKAWVQNRNIDARRLAMPILNSMVQSFFSGNTTMTCQQLDSAIAKLKSRVPLPEEAIGVRVEPALIDSAANPQLRLYWTYATGAKPVTVKFGRKQWMLEPGQTISEPLVLDEIRGDKEQNLTFNIGGRKAEVMLTRVSNLRQRLSNLKVSGVVAEELKEIAGGKRPELVRGYLKSLKSAEMTNEPTTSLRYVQQGNVPIRLALPRILDPSGSTVVIALHGAGGNEHMFMESYGSGQAVKEARRRGWLFMSPKSMSRSVPACLEWLASKGVRVNQYFVMGHSMGGGVALSSYNSQPKKPMAMGLFAPAAGGLDKVTIPSYVAIGQQDSLFSGRISGLVQQAKTNPLVEIKVVDPCDHLMIVADELSNTYRFFDKVLLQSSR